MLLIDGNCKVAIKQKDLGVFMSFQEQINSAFDKSISQEQADNLSNELKSLDKFFNENYAETQAFQTKFYEKFQNLLEQYGIGEAYEENFIATLYGIETFESLATYLVTTGRSVTGSDDYCDWVYEQIIESFREE